MGLTGLRDFAAIRCRFSRAKRRFLAESTPENPFDTKI
ncbi:hypothetical protein PY32053_00175 [Paracoccus yeei]|uniref:Uncharacterized protein n=1 Tax=Paracoccus yeei TaxID=147645 RepID=A0A386UGU3_9RHOB|nr:hypothetical protein PY32053_00175 [Paracoccus yeei]